MRHLDDGTLRRMQDEPISTGGDEQEHYQACERCRERAMSIATEATRAAQLLAVPEPVIETGVALARLRTSAAGQHAYAPSRWRSLRRGFVIGGNRTLRPVAALALACVAMVALVVTGVAENVINVFEPHHFQAVQVTPDQLKGLPDLSSFGDMKFTRAPTFTPAAGAAEAQAQSGVTLLSPDAGAIPSRVKQPPGYIVVGQFSASFTFSAARAEAWATANGKTLPAMPAGLDGSTINITGGPGVIMLYGAPDNIGAALSGAPSGTNARRPSTAGDAPAAVPARTPAPRVAAPQVGEPAAPQAKPQVASGSASFNPSTFKIPDMAIVQMKSPKVTSTGASVQEIEDYLLSLPGFPPDLAAQIRAIGDPATTLPVPVPTGQESKQVDVMGVEGLFVGDSTGLGSGMIWSKDGILYGTVGTLTESEVTGVARSLH